MTPEQLMRAQSVDVARTAQAREMAEQKHRNQIYSLATTIMVKNSELCVGPGEKLAYETLVRQSLELATIMFDEIVKMEKEHAERRNAESSGTKSNLQLP